MSGQHPPLDCRQVKSILKHYGFRLRNQVGSHEQWVGKVGGRFRKVTVDCPKEPFTRDLLNFMIEQSGLTRKQWYEAVR